MVGVGGLGCPAAQYLAAAGVGRLTLIDSDHVSVTNLHRQILFGPQDVGLPKVKVAARRLREMVPGVDVNPVPQRLEESSAAGVLAGHEVIIDSTDTFSSRLLVADAAERLGIPVAWGAVQGWHGQVTVFTADARMRDVFPEEPVGALDTCEGTSVLGSLCGQVGTALVTSLPGEPSDLAPALGRRAAQGYAARHASPPFDNSGMDGYAVRHHDLHGARPESPVALTVAGETAAGMPPAQLPPGTAWRIMTGAPMPAGADAVVPVESTDGATERVTIFAEPSAGAHVRRAGEDARPGDTIVRAGQRLTAARLAALAAVGVGAVDAVRPARVAIIATGDELVDAAALLAPGQIHDSNSVLLAGLIREAGAQPLVLDRVGDRPAEFLSVLSNVNADLVITTGGVSVGEYDVVKEALSNRGVEFVRVAMQPGKPQGLGTVHDTPIACLPGNPVSVLVSFATIVAPMIARLQGAWAPQRERMDAGAAVSALAQQWTEPGTD